MKDLTIISNIMMSDGIGRQGIGMLKCVHQDLDVNVFRIGSPNYKDVPVELLNTLSKPFDGFGKVAFWTYILGLNEQMIPIHANIKSNIKIAYTMFESDAIPNLWVKILNTYYDLAVVPDPWLVKVYKKCGVNIPIFVIPLGILIEDLLQHPLKSAKNDVFTFGMSAGFWQRKNHLKLLNAFAQEFGNNDKFKLKLHGRFGPYKVNVQKEVNKLNLKNVELIDVPLSNYEYNDFLKSLDCYVFPSQGEGFSVTPREAIALGLPCILSNNTVHKTICDSGFVLPVKADQKSPAIYEVFNNSQLGYFYDCSLEDLCQAMLEVYNNYDQYIKNSLKGREWVKQYLWDSLKPTYLNLFRPKEIVLGDENIITDCILQTSSKKLYKKYNDSNLVNHK